MSVFQNGTFLQTKRVYWWKPFHVIVTTPVLSNSGYVSRRWNTWFPLSSLTSTDNDHRSRFLLDDVDDEICVMHTYDTLCLHSLSSLGIRSQQCIINAPYHHHNPSSHFSVIMVQGELVDIYYYFRRHFEFSLVVSNNYCFCPPGHDKRSPWWWPFPDEHRRLFIFNLVVSKKCFRPPGNDKWSSWRRRSYHSQRWAKDFLFISKCHLNNQLLSFKES